MSFVADLMDTITASTLQIGGYHSYQHRKLQTAQVTITEPRSGASVWDKTKKIEPMVIISVVCGIQNAA